MKCMKLYEIWYVGTTMALRYRVLSNYFGGRELEKLEYFVCRKWSFQSFDYKFGIQATYS